jgi:hypothetical protein
VAKGKTAAQIGREIRAALSKTVAETMTMANHALIAANPVATTHSRNNWILSKGRPHKTVDGSRESPSDAMQQAGLTEAMSFDVGRDRKMFLTNNVDYVEFLDKGSSPQAEAGYVARAFADGVAAAPRGRKTATRKMLAGLARTAYVRGV